MLRALFRVFLLEELVQDVVDLLVGVDDLELLFLHPTVTFFAHLALLEELSQF